MFRWLRLMVIWGLGVAATLTALIWLCPKFGSAVQHSRFFMFGHYGRAVVLDGAFEKYDLNTEFDDHAFHARPFSLYVSQEEDVDLYDSFLLDISWRVRHGASENLGWSFYHFGFNIVDSPITSAICNRSVYVVLPCWFVVLALAAYPSLAFSRGPLRRWHRRRHNRCEKCAYDLTGLTEPRCPECGTKIEKRTARIERKSP